MKYDVTKVLDCKGLSCPMPVIKTKKELDNMDSGEILEVHATDKGSESDLRAWANTVGHKYLAIEKKDDILKHYIEKS